MKKMRVLMLATLMGAAVSGQAFADDTSGQSGTMTFNATLQEGTCTITGQNIANDFGNLPVNTPVLSNFNGWKAYKVFHNTIAFTDCPDGVNSVSVTPTYTSGEVSGAVGNSISSADGGAKLNMRLMKTDDESVAYDADTIYRTGVTETYPVTNNAVNIPMQQRITSAYTNPLSAGNASFNVQLAFSYQ